MAEIRNRYVLVEDKAALKSFIDDCNKAGIYWDSGKPLKFDEIFKKEYFKGIESIGFDIDYKGVTWKTAEDSIEEWRDNNVSKYQPDAQPQPYADESQRPIVAMVMEDLIKRMEKGVKDYGQALRANNGRNPLQDAYEEALDLACYLKQAMIEAENGTNR